MTLCVQCLSRLSLSCMYVRVSIPICVLIRINLIYDCAWFDSASYSARLLLLALLFFATDVSAVSDFVWICCMSTCLTAYLSSCLSTCLTAYLSSCMSTCLTAYLSSCVSTCLTDYLSNQHVYLTAYLSSCVSTFLTAYLSSCMFTCMTAYLSSCVSTCLTAYLSSCVSTCLSGKGKL